MQLTNLYVINKLWTDNFEWVITESLTYVAWSQDTWCYLPIVSVRFERYQCSPLRCYVSSQTSTVPVRIEKTGRRTACDGEQDQCWGHRAGRSDTTQGRSPFRPKRVNSPVHIKSCDQRRVWTKISVWTPDTKRDQRWNSKMVQLHSPRGRIVSVSSLCSTFQRTSSELLESGD